MSESGSGRRGFVRDVMKRISSQGSRDDLEREGRPQDDVDELESLRDALRVLGPDAGELVRRIERLLMEYELLRQRFDRSRQQIYDAERQNE